MKRPILFLISGWKGSGKTTIANYLNQKHNTIQYALADPLKDSVSKAYGVSRVWCDRQEFKEKPLKFLPVLSKLDRRSYELDEFWTPRALCQYEGGMRRRVDPLYWTKLLVKSIEDETTFDYHISVADVRYPNELEYLTEKLSSDYHVVHIRVYRFETSTSRHESERALDDITPDYIINNVDKTLGELYAQVDNIVKSINSTK